MAAWILVVCFVPVWFSVVIGYTVAPAELAALGILVGSVSLAGGGLLKADLLLLAMVLLALLPLAIGGTHAFVVLPLILQTTLGYLVGRLVALRAGLEWTMSFLVVVLSCVALLAAVEFVLTWNPFVGLARPNAAYQTWSPLQARGGIIRAEGAFGHSIALGCSLALAVPLAITRPWPVGARVATALVLLAGTVVSFSRSGMICAVFGLLLSMFLIRGKVPTKLRVAMMFCIVVGMAVALPRVTAVFSSAGQEAEGSAAYRNDLLQLFSEMSVLGTSPIGHQTAAGVLTWGRFVSIDNALVLFGLQYGLIPLILAVVGLVAAVIWVMIGRGTPPMVSLIAQTPALVTVALITQYGMFLMFFVGLAVATLIPSHSALALSVDREVGLAHETA